MSEIKVNSIKGVGASTAAITVNNTDGTCSVNNTKRQGKNLIINGNMRIAVRATSSTSNGYQTVDRFRSDIDGVSTTFTQSRQDLSSSDTGPYEVGLRNYKRIALAGAGTAAAGGYVEATAYRVEAQDLATSGWNYTSSSSNLSLQFWFRCSTNQTFYAAIRTDDTTARMFSFSFTASGNNTWTKVTKVISGNSGITINNDTGIGMSIFIIPYYGTNFTANGTALDTWRTYDSAAHFPDMADTWLTAGASTFDLTGIQLEVGDKPTDFIHEPFDENLRRCQRYFQQHTLVSGAATAYNSASDGYRWWVSFSSQMRDTPTMTSSGGTDGGSVASFSIAYSSKEGYTAVLSSNDSSSDVWYYGAKVQASSEL